MGIKGLTTLIKKYVPESIKEHPYEYFKGSIIAIDTSILLYKFHYSNNNPNAHIIGFLNKCLRYIRSGIIPVFILDGKPPPEKKNILNKRLKQRNKVELKIKELKKLLLTETYNEENNKSEIIAKIKKLNKQTISVTKEHHAESKELLQSLGFTVINSIGEAEELCALLQKENIVDFTYSDDTDVFVLGCKKVLRSNTKMNTFFEINLDCILNGFGLNIDEFIDLCILCGCDYCSNIPRLTHDNAYKLIKKFKTIENIIEEVQKTNEYEIPENFKYQNARNIFKTENDNENIFCMEGIKIPEVKLDERRLTNFLLKKKFKKRYIQSYINKFKNNKTLHIPRSSSNSSIESYFSI